MTTSVLMVYVDQMEAVRTEAKMDTAQAVLYSTLEKSGASRLWSAWTNEIMSAMRSASDAVGSFFTFNGQPVGVKRLKRLVMQRIEGARVE